MNAALYSEQVMSRRRRRLTVDEYEKMGAAGVLPAGERTELINGEIINVTPMGSRHAAAITLLLDALSHTSGGKYFVTSQIPVRLGSRNEPEPDVLVLQRSPSGYAAGHPEAADIVLLIEVCDSSVEFDREIKVPMYAASGIQQVWIVDVSARKITVFTDPAGGVYHSVRDFLPVDEVTLPFEPPVNLGVWSFLPKE